jgi:tRNA A37 N6-isopentenylltransferase MiaA
MQVLADQINVEKAITHASGRCWAYARRQRTWFRGEPISHTISAGASQPPVAVAAALQPIARDLIEQPGG